MEYVTCDEVGDMAHGLILLICSYRVGIWNESEDFVPDVVRGVVRS